MTDKPEFGEIGGREWLSCRHKGVERRYAFPPVQGTHRDCYQALKEDSKVVPAEGLDLALIANGAYTQKSKRWTKVRKDCFVSRYANTRSPTRMLWVPEYNELAGIVLERDLEGKGRTSEMKLPENIGGWKKGDNGIYASPDNQLIFVPAGSYKLGEHSKRSFAKDGFATAVFTAEGAEIFAKTAVDAKRTPWTCGISIDDISEPEQKVVDLDEHGDKLYLLGVSWGDSNCYAFGRAKEEGR
jgi:hypothetical protein